MRQAMEQPVEVLALGQVVAEVVEVAEPPRRHIELDGADRRLHVLAPIGGRVRVRQIEAVDLDERQAVAPDLLADLCLEALVDRELLDPEPEERLDVLGQELEEGELIALEVLRDGEAERRLGVEADGAQDLDPEIDIAVGLLPLPVGPVQRVRAIGRRIEARQEGLEHRLRTRGGSAPTSATCRGRSRGASGGPASPAPCRSRRRPSARSGRSRS